MAIAAYRLPTRKNPDGVSEVATGNVTDADVAVLVAIGFQLAKSIERSST